MESPGAIVDARATPDRQQTAKKRETSVARTFHALRHDSISARACLECLAVEPAVPEQATIVADDTRGVRRLRMGISDLARAARVRTLDSRMRVKVGSA